MSFFLKNHSNFLYPYELCITSLEACIQRGKTDEALFWLCQIGSGGYGKYLLSNQLSTFACESIGLGWADLPVRILEITHKFERLSKTKPAAGGQAVGFRNAYTLPEIRDMMFNLVGQMCKAPKTRLAANAYRYALANLTSKSKDWVPSADNKEKGWDALWYEIKSTMETPLPAAPADQLARELKWLTAAVAMFIAINKISSPSARRETWRTIWGKLIAWTSEKYRQTPVVAQTIKSMYDFFMDDKGKSGMGDRRLTWMHVLLLADGTRRAQFAIPSLPTADEKKHGLAVLDPKNKDNLLAGRLFAVPDCAINMFTSRGRSKDRASTVPALQEHAKVSKIDISKWSPAEIAKSHGVPPAPLDQDKGSEYNRLYREYALMSNVYIQPDPYEGLAKASAIADEQEMKKATSDSLRRTVAVVRVWKTAGLRVQLVKAWGIDSGLFLNERAKLKQLTRKRAKAASASASASTAEARPKTKRVKKVKGDVEVKPEAKSEEKDEEEQVKE